MVSKAREDFPDPETPVMTTSFPRGISISIDLRLCSRAPRMMMASVPIRFLPAKSIFHYTALFCSDKTGGFVGFIGFVGFHELNEPYRLNEPDQGSVGGFVGS